MSNVILIRLHPTEPTDPNEFTGYLNNLTIAAYDLSFDKLKDSEQEQVGQDASFSQDYLQTQIFQHFGLNKVGEVPDLVDKDKKWPIEIPTPLSFATAIITDTTSNLREYVTWDIRLEIKRNEKVIIDQNVYYNCAIRDLNLPDYLDAVKPIPPEVPKPKQPKESDYSDLEKDKYKSDLMDYALKEVWYLKYKYCNDYINYDVKQPGFYVLVEPQLPRLEDYSPEEYTDKINEYIYNETQYLEFHYYLCYIDYLTTLKNALDKVTDSSFYLALPKPDYDLDPNSAHVEIPLNGTPPKFSDLKRSVEIVLRSDQAILDDDLNIKYEDLVNDNIADPNIKERYRKIREDLAQKVAELTPEQSRHIAYEIVWNRQMYPLPVPPNPTQRSLDVLYTLPDDNDKKQDRKQFEADLASYYSKHNAEAERLAGFVYSLSAAVSCELMSRAAQRAGFQFPIIIAKEPDSTARIGEAIVILSNAGMKDNSTMNLDNLGLSFIVPAEYFYALGARMPAEVTPEQRYQMAIHKDEKKTFNDLKKAVASEIIFGLSSESLAVNPAQAARRLSSLGLAKTGIDCPIAAEQTSLIKLIQDWLNYSKDWYPDNKNDEKKNDILGFWKGANLNVLNSPSSLPYLRLVLCAVTNNHEPLIKEIENGTIIKTVKDLAEKDTNVWSVFFPSTKTDLLPPFTLPGKIEERISAFIRRLRNFFEVKAGDNAFSPGSIAGVPGLSPIMSDPIQRFIEYYNKNHDEGQKDFVFGNIFSSVRAWSEIEKKIDSLPQSDAAINIWLKQKLKIINDLYALTVDSAESFDYVTQPDPFRFSLMEALYARGFTGEDSISNMLFDDFHRSLTGTLAFNRSVCEKIYIKAGGTISSPDAESKEFHPINPDGTLINCIPPYHLSPLSPIAYLKEMLFIWKGSTCENPLYPRVSSFSTLRDNIASRRGPLENLLATRANLETPIPLIDLVNECLEALVAKAPSDTIYNTAVDKVGGHDLCQEGNPLPPENERNDQCHDPAILFDALPEHSSPATPPASTTTVTMQQAAYDTLAKDFSSPILPYSQPLDICRSYLRQMSTNRYAVMRRFRKDITEFVLDPINSPGDFQAYLWRYPVRIDIAREYLGISPEEYDQLFTKEIYISKETNTQADQLLLWELYGFYSSTDLMPLVTKVPEFLKRTGLTYCEFLDLKKSEFVKFKVARSPLSSEDDLQLPDCEPCCLYNYWIQFIDPKTPEEALKRLAIFIRLWRKLQDVKGARYSFWQLRDICEVLHLFKDDSINPDFIRQLTAFQMLRDHLGLCLTDNKEIPQNSTGAERTHLLALWVEEESALKWHWAVDHLLDRIQSYAEARHGHGRRSSRFIKLLEGNLDPLSMLAGFNPKSIDSTWHAYPTHTLRFAEVLSKLYASKFGVGEIIYLFAAKDHLDGDDPYPLQDVNESLDSPLGLPDDEEAFSLWSLRQKLLGVDISKEDYESWTWTKIEASLRNDFGYVPPNNNGDPLISLGEHFFPSFLQASGYSVADRNRQYRVDVTSTSSLMWNTPQDGPFQCDPSSPNNPQLWTQLPLKDEEVIAKLSRIRQLKDKEPGAVQKLYFLPREDLARFAFIFSNFNEADRCLIQEADETKRWSYFQREFARFHKRCSIIAEHLAEHVVSVTGQENSEGIGLAWCLLKHLLADENRGTGNTSWEDDHGKLPDITWRPQPNGGAFDALLGLIGTGLLGEFTTEDGSIAWREICGPMNAFGPEENACCSPLPTVIPSMNLDISWDQKRFVNVRNGFALFDPNGQMLGSAQGFTVCWQGALLIEKEGTYEFWAGAPTPDGEKPNFESAEHRRWRVILKRGQKTWILISHHWPDERAPAVHSTPLPLKRGVYHISIQFAQKQPEFSKQEEIHPRTTGFQLKYSGPDSLGVTVAIPFDKLFLEKKDSNLSDKMVGESEVVKAFLDLRFISTLRDIRRTYQRAFKALLFAHRFCLSAEPVSDDGQSEIGYMLAHPDKFAGISYYYENATFKSHYVYFDFNFFPILDSYYPPTTIQDQRAGPSVQRQQAIFDWWERVFDYTIMRAEAQTAPEHPVWLLFHEAAENHPDDPAHLLRHIGVDLRHDMLVLRYYPSYDSSLSSSDLEDERWPVRVWQAEKWIRALLWHFAAKDIRYARTALWAYDDPNVSITITLPSNDTLHISGNSNLTKFFRDGCIENGEPRRYKDIANLNNRLRERARQALLAYLCGMKRVPLTWLGGDADGNPMYYAKKPKDLSDLLLLDVEAGLCEKASRIEEAISALQTYIQRCRLGLEPDFQISPEFGRMWDRRFSTFRVWEACKRREIYQENWIEWKELDKARHTEAFRLLESEQRRGTLAVPASNGYLCWHDQSPPAYPGLSLLQERDGGQMQEPDDPSLEGYSLLGSPERDALPSWLASIQDEKSEASTFKSIPFWMETAIRLGTRFVRVAASGKPPSSAILDANDQDSEAICCAQCGKIHSPVVDEYYFWLMDSSYYKEIQQDAEWHASNEVSASSDLEHPESDWHNPGLLPKLLYWGSDKMVRLAWCRVHNGELQQLRRSDEGVYISDSSDSDGSTPRLQFLGRNGDSLKFMVSQSENPTGYPDSPPPGFRYDLATDSAVVLPLPDLSKNSTTASPDGNSEGDAQEPSQGPGGLTAYPYFAYFALGHHLLPSSFFSPALSVASWLRTHCQFEAALKWYELAFNPLQDDCTWCMEAHISARAKTELNLEGIEPVPSKADENGPCCSDRLIEEPALRQILQHRSVTLHYIETLLQWGDAVMHRNTPEAFQKAKLIFDTASRILGVHPQSLIAKDIAANPQKVIDFIPRHATLNPRLLALYDLIDDRLALIRACSNDHRLHNGRIEKDMLYWGTRGKGPQYPAQVCHSWQAPDRICPEEDWCCPYSPYRYTFLAQKAQEIAGEVRGFGAALLAAFEKGDTECMSSLRTGHERQLLDLALVIRQNQWREADWQVQALQKTMAGAQTRWSYNNALIKAGLNGGEMGYQSLVPVSIASREAGNISEAIAQGTAAVPDTHAGGAGLCSPLLVEHLPIGTKSAGIFSTVARIANNLAEVAGTTSQLSLTEAGWDRRVVEWYHQKDVIGIEIEQIERQILAAERRRDIVLRELNNHQQQMENAAEVQDFLRDKFTNDALYLYLQKETAALHFQMYELALHEARQAQRAFNYERGYTSRNFIPSEAWDNLHDGLMAGERLSLALRRMEKAYLDENVREYELTKHISMRLNFPLEFLCLRTTGRCEIVIPEWMFDLDYPGQFMRRIKNVTLTLPCIVGPYTGVHCRLTLLSSTTRVDPRLRDPPASCCGEKKKNNRYSAMPNDPRIINLYAATEAIATSGGQNDSGLFELSFKDERYLPFEFAGAISRWRIELPKENNRFDVSTLSDVILHLNYTAREGGDMLSKAATEVAQQHLPADGVQFFDVRYDLPDAWQLFQQHTTDKKSPKQFDLKLANNMFPYNPGGQKIQINRLELFFEARGECPSAQKVVEFLLNRRTGPGIEDQNEHVVRNIYCDTSADWPGLYHGVLDIPPMHLVSNIYCDVGTFQFPFDVGEISDVFLFCGYRIARTQSDTWWQPDRQMMP